MFNITFSEISILQWLRNAPCWYGNRPPRPKQLITRPLRASDKNTLGRFLSARWSVRRYTAGSRCTSPTDAFRPDGAPNTVFFSVQRIPLFWKIPYAYKKFLYYRNFCKSEKYIKFVYRNSLLKCMHFRISALIVFHNNKTSDISDFFSKWQK